MRKMGFCHVCGKLSTEGSHEGCKGKGPRGG